MDPEYLKTLKDIRKLQSQLNILQSKLNKAEKNPSSSTKVKLTENLIQLTMIVGMSVFAFMLTRQAWLAGWGYVALWPTCLWIISISISLTFNLFRIPMFSQPFLVKLFIGVFGNIIYLISMWWLATYPPC